MPGIFQTRWLFAIPNPENRWLSPIIHLAPVREGIDTQFRTQMLDRLRTISELHTGVAMVQTIVANSQGTRILGLELGSTKLLYVAVGTVRAGVDLADLKPEDIVIESTHIQVTLPAARILDKKIDVEKSYCYDVRKSLVMSPDAIQLQENAQRKALEEVEKAAIQCGLLDMAQEQAKTVLSSLLFMAGFKEVKVQVAVKAQQGDQQVEK